MKDNFELWFNSLNVFNQYANYADVRAYLKYTAQRNAQDNYVGIIDNLFKKARIDDIGKLGWDSYTAPEEFTKIMFNAVNVPDDMVYSEGWQIVRLLDGKKYLISKDVNGKYGAIVKSGKYQINIEYKKIGWIMMFR